MKYLKIIAINIKILLIFNIIIYPFLFTVIMIIDGMHHSETHFGYSLLPSKEGIEIKEENISLTPKELSYEVCTSDVEITYIFYTEEDLNTVFYFPDEMSAKLFLNDSEIAPSGHRTNNFLYFDCDTITEYPVFLEKGDNEAILTYKLSGSAEESGYYYNIVYNFNFLPSPQEFYKSKSIVNLTVETDYMKYILSKEGKWLKNKSGEYKVSCNDSEKEINIKVCSGRPIYGKLYSLIFFPVFFSPLILFSIYKTIKIIIKIKESKALKIKKSIDITEV